MGEELNVLELKHVNGFVPMVQRLRAENDALREELALQRFAARLGWAVAVTVSAGFAIAACML